MGQVAFFAFGWVVRYFLNDTMKLCRVCHAKFTFSLRLIGVGTEVKTDRFTHRGNTLLVLNLESIYLLTRSLASYFRSQGVRIGLLT